jgi:hypothetical protein
VPAIAAAEPGTHVSCPMPPLAGADAVPLQSPVPASMSSFRLAVAELQPLAGFSVDARVLSREDYKIGREAELSPTDLALGWGRMREDAVLSRLAIKQSARAGININGPVMPRCRRPRSRSRAPTCT